MHGRRVDLVIPFGILSLCSPGLLRESPVYSVLDTYRRTFDRTWQRTGGRLASPCGDGARTFIAPRPAAAPLAPAPQAVAARSIPAAVLPPAPAPPVTNEKARDYWKAVVAAYHAALRAGGRPPGPPPTPLVPAGKTVAQLKDWWKAEAMRLQGLYRAARSGS